MTARDADEQPGSSDRTERSSSRHTSGEFEIIARYFAPLADDPGAFGLLDDAAQYAVPAGKDLVVTADTLVAGVHFLPDDPPDAIARKALRVNISDLAAKAAEPVAYLLSLALDKSWTEDWLKQFAQGLRDDQHLFKISLLGGDTVRTPGPLTLSVTAFGTVPSGAMMQRRTARPGDLIYVSGTIGDAALGLKLRNGDITPATWRLSDSDSGVLQSRYLIPDPRPQLRDALAENATAAMDVSDGLLGDLQKMFGDEAIGAHIVLDRIPLSSAARHAAVADSTVWRMIVSGGDDYEILAAIPASRARQFEHAAGKEGIAVTCIGQFVSTPPGIHIDDPENRISGLAHGSYAHF